MKKLIAIAFIIPVYLSAAIQFDISGTYTQNFDSLGTTDQTWVQNDTLTGWYIWPDSTFAADAQLLAATDASTRPTDTYFNFGNAAASDRALGFFTGNSFNGSPTTPGNGTEHALVVQFHNNSGLTVNVSELSFIGEQWGISNTNPTSMNSYFRVSSTELTLDDFDPQPIRSSNNGWANLGGTFRPAMPNTGPDNSTYLSFDGSLSENQNIVSGNPDITVLPGEYLAIAFKIMPQNRSTAGAIDDFTLTYTPVPEPAHLAAILGLIGLLLVRRRR